MKQGFDDGLFTEGRGTLADLEEGATAPDPAWDDEDEDKKKAEWDDEDPLRMDEGGRQVS